MKHFLLLVSCALLVVACQADKRFAQMRPGMTKAEVTALLGKSQGYKLEDSGAETYRYNGDHYVKFRNGRAIEYGED